MKYIKLSVQVAWLNLNFVSCKVRECYDDSPLPTITSHTATERTGPPPLQAASIAPSEVGSCPLLSFVIIIHALTGRSSATTLTFLTTQVLKDRFSHTTTFPAISIVLSKVNPHPPPLSIVPPTPSAVDPPSPLSYYFFNHVFISFTVVGNWNFNLIHDSESSQTRIN